MKKLFIKVLFAAVLTIPALGFAQKECNFAIQDTTAGQELRTTGEYLMHEKVFGGNSQYVFFTLSNSQGLPMVNFQLLAKGKEFPKVYCLDKASKIYLQLENGKVVTLLSATEEQCSGLIYDETQKNNIRVLTGVFLFTKGSPEELEKSPVTFMRVKYSGETVDYPLRAELKSETMGKTYNPENYFIDYIKCIK